MATILDQLRIWVEQIISSLGYIGIAFLMFIENLFPPFPSEVIMPFAGSLVARGKMNGLAVFTAGTIGAVAGAVAIYYIGVLVTGRRARNWFEAHGHWLLMSEKDYDRAENQFERHGKKMVLIGRLMPAIRSLISLPAGLNRMQMLQFLVYTVLGTTIWNVILLVAGIYLGQNWQQVIQFINAYEYIVWGVLGVAVLYYIYKRISASNHEEHQSTT